MKKIVCLIFCIMEGVGLMSAQNNTLTIDEVFDITSHINGFQEIEYVEDDMGFPYNIGTPTMIIHGNADPREAIIDLIDRLPNGSLVFDDTNEQGKFDRMFFDENTSHLLYVHVGLGGNDTVLILFRGGKKQKIKEFLEGL